MVIQLFVDLEEKRKEHVIPVKKVSDKISRTIKPTMITFGGSNTINTVTIAQTLSIVDDLTTVKLTVNRRTYYLQVEPNWPLRDVLRQKLGLTSLKDFCNGYGACGSCTVIMNCRPILSCMILAVECDGAVIETAEGIAESNHPLVEACIMNWAAQCGYCTPGFLVTAKCLLDHNPDPTEDEIKEAISGNLCRCGNYPAQIKAVLEAAKELKRG
jgi:aerobic-type carbon monoxide dehydrogenase small subunit (CoxS/CutS family)